VQEQPDAADTSFDTGTDTFLPDADDLADPPDDTIADLPPDAPLDSPVDTGVDTTVDTGVDTLVDTGVDTTVDTGVDSPVDTVGDDGPGGCTGMLLAADFELSNGGFVETPGSSVWDWGTIGAGPSPGSHGKVWATNLSGTYGACDDAFLTSPAIDLSACSGVTLTLTFDTWYEYERYGLAYYDGFIVEFWNGSAWVKIAPVGGWDHTIQIYGCSGIYVSGEDGFAYESGGWVVKTFTVSLTSYPSTFQLRFVHGSDSDGHYYGAYIDNVRLSAS